MNNLFLSLGQVFKLLSGLTFLLLPMTWLLVTPTVCVRVPLLTLPLVEAFFFSASLPSSTAPNV